MSTQSNYEPLVTAVIPTCRRPQLVVRAVQSALAQTLTNLEIIVVPADASGEVRQALAHVGDRRLRVLPDAGRLSASVARNRGVEHAHGTWIAFLDDDDYWLPDKLQLQWETALESTHRRPVVSCGMLVRDGRSERVWPRSLPVPGEPIGDYLFRRKGLLGASGYLQTSTLFALRELLLEVPFRDDFHPVEDLDWILRAVQRKNVGVEFVMDRQRSGAKPLMVWNIDRGRPRESLSHGWRRELQWIRQNRDLVGSRAYASYLLTWVSHDAGRESAGLWEFWQIWREASRNGRPSLLDIAVHMGHWLVPWSSLQAVSGWLTGTRAR